MIYIKLVLRALLIAVVSLLLFDASGAFALVSPEACTALVDELPDGQCPALCVRCSCGVQPVVPDAAPATSFHIIRSFVPPTFVTFTADGSPRAIFHVPK